MFHACMPTCASKRSVLAVIHRYKSLKAMSPEERKTVVPRVCIIGGKAAPGYDIAKRIIKLVWGRNEWRTTGAKLCSKHE